jgi:hypothetical protein
MPVVRMVVFNREVQVKNAEQIEASQPPTV